MAVNWTAKMTTGVPRIDDQHKELIRQINALLDAMRQGKGKDEIGRMLDFLYEYTVKHFADEEAEMERTRCPAAAANKREHQKFCNAVAALRKEFDANGATAPLILRVQREVLDWIVKHIQGIDTKLAETAAAAAR